MIWLVFVAVYLGLGVATAAFCAWVDNNNPPGLMAKIVVLWPIFWTIVLCLMLGLLAKMLGEKCAK